MTRTDREPVTTIRVQPAAHRCRVITRDGLLAVRVLRSDARGARVALVATAALLLAGDRVLIEVRVDPGGWLEIVDVAGTVAFDAAGREASWTAHVDVGAGGLFTWAAEPFVLATGANVQRRSVLELDPGGVAVVRETLVWGRSGEAGGALHTHTRVCCAGEELLVETLAAPDPATRRRPGMLGPARVLDAVGCFGRPAPPDVADVPGERFDLDGPGTLLRRLGPDTGDLAGGRWFSACAAAARAAYELAR